jgi:hypothetical protein
MSRKHTHGGQYLERDWTGRLSDTTRRGTPDVVICRRVVDYAPSPLPTGARLAVCRQCWEPVVYDPAGPHPERPKICLQCGGIEPLPIES